MSDDSNPTPQPSSAPDISVDAGSVGNANLIYILYLAGFILGGITSVVGVVMAYIGKDEADAVVQSHYNNQINIFWKGLLYMVVGSVLSLILIGFLVLLWGAVWYAVRSIKGIQAAGRGEMIPDAGTWGL